MTMWDIYVRVRCVCVHVCEARAIYEEMCTGMSLRVRVLVRVCWVLTKSFLCPAPILLRLGIQQLS